MSGRETIHFVLFCFTSVFSVLFSVYAALCGKNTTRTTVMTLVSK